MESCQTYLSHRLTSEKHISWKENAPVTLWADTFAESLLTVLALRALQACLTVFNLHDWWIQCLTSVCCIKYSDIWVMPVTLQLPIRDWMPTEVNARKFLSLSMQHKMHFPSAKAGRTTAVSLSTVAEVHHHHHHHHHFILPKNKNIIFNNTIEIQ